MAVDRFYVKKFWPKDIIAERDRYIVKLYKADLFDMETIIDLVKTRFGRTINKATAFRIIKKYANK